MSGMPETADTKELRVPTTECSDWEHIASAFAEFPAPEVTVLPEGEPMRAGWVFRGLKNSVYKLRPTIEREGLSKNMEWPTLEELVVDEFMSRAHLHHRPPFAPRDRLTWLAHMQHYGIPTRLLDFTYSPWIALYFAIRDGEEKNHKRTHVRVWAVKSESVNRHFSSTARKARRAELSRQGKRTGSPASLNPDDAVWEHEAMAGEIAGSRGLITESLKATGAQRRVLNEMGCVCAAQPPEFNARLANQQGLFLLNCAAGLRFEESLTKMMNAESSWAKTFDIPVGLIPDIERQLFQMNIHEQSMFPDMEGLAGLIGQKLRLHWK